MSSRRNLWSSTTKEYWTKYKETKPNRKGSKWESWDQEAQEISGDEEESPHFSEAYEWLNAEKAEQHTWYHDPKTYVCKDQPSSSSGPSKGSGWKGQAKGQGKSKSKKGRHASVGSSNLSDVWYDNYIWEPTKPQSIGNNKTTNVLIEGPFHDDVIPLELYEKCSPTSIKDVEKHIEETQRQ